MGLMQVQQQIQQEIKRKKALREFEAKLKNHILNAPPIEAAKTIELVGKGFNVFDMTKSGIEFADALHDALTLTRSMRLVEDVSKESQIVSTAIRGSERFMFALEALGPLVTYISFWLDLAGAWAKAKANILTDNAMYGMSTGVVLGANDMDPSYVGHNFWMTSDPDYPMYREAQKAAKNIYNIALIAGYAQGKSLTVNQRKRLFRFLGAYLTSGQSAFYFSKNAQTGEESSWETWSAASRRNYLLDLGAIFRRELLTDDDDD
jgi:hypothetical protein